MQPRIAVRMAGASFLEVSLALTFEAALDLERILAFAFRHRCRPTTWEQTMRGRLLLRCRLEAWAPVAHMPMQRRTCGYEVVALV